MSAPAFWTDAAAGWVRHAETQDRYGWPLGAAAFDALAVRPGESVLDAGCGCGGTTAALAARVGPAGAVVGVDLSAAMIDAARDRFPGLSFVAGDLASVPLPPVDAVYSRMALMLLDPPAPGLAAIRRALRPGGRLAATVFRSGRENPWLALVLLGAAPHLGPLPPLPMGDEPGPFTWAEPSRASAALTAAGFGAVSVTPVDVTVDAPPEALEWLIEVGPAGPAYRAAPEPARAAARAGVAGLLARFAGPDGWYHLPSGLHLITAAV
jgi:SAM-dependent methyltransferase